MSLWVGRDLKLQFIVTTTAQSKYASVQYRNAAYPEIK